MVLKAFSFGGGVQSTAALVLAAQGRIDYHTFLFCNVGEDSENPDTLTYVQEVATIVPAFVFVFAFSVVARQQMELRERAELIGGTLTCGPDPMGWTVRLRLPA